MDFESQTINTFRRAKRPGKTLSEAQTLDLFNICLNLKKEYKESSGNAFWEQVSIRLEPQIRRSYSYKSCQAQVKRYIAKREAYLKECVTGDAGENKSSLHEAIDQWIAFLDNLAEEKRLELENKEADDRANTLRRAITHDVPGSAIQIISSPTLNPNINTESESLEEGEAPIFTRPKTSSRRQRTLDLLSEIVALQREDMKETHSILREFTKRRLESTAELDSDVKDRVKRLETEMLDMKTQLSKIADGIETLVRRST